jgi:hypothetical protein
MRVPSSTSIDKAQVDGQSCGQTEAFRTRVMGSSVTGDRPRLQRGQTKLGSP